jgi:hypothetical protein
MLILQCNASHSPNQKRAIVIPGLRALTGMDAAETQPVDILRRVLTMSGAF